MDNLFAGGCRVVGNEKKLAVVKFHLKKKKENALLALSLYEFNQIQAGSGPDRTYSIDPTNCIES